MTGPDLLSAIRAALDDTERLARAAESVEWHAREPDAFGCRVVAISHAVGQVTASILAGNAEHIARHDPAAVLRSVAAVREIVDEYEAELARGPARPMVHVAESEARHGGILDAYQHVVRALARGLGIDPEETPDGRR